MHFMCFLLRAELSKLNRDINFLLSVNTMLLMATQLKEPSLLFDLFKAFD